MNWITEHATVLSAVVSAIATVFIAGFTIKLSRATSSQLSQLKGQLDLANKEFVSTHRPLIKIRLVRLVDPGQEVTKPLTITFDVVNSGRSKCTVTGGFARIHYFGETIGAYEYENRDLDIPHRPFEIGATDRYEVISKNFNWRTQSPNRVEGREIHLIGYIVYEDSAGNARTTAFCRRYNTRRGRFDPVDDTDYEYED